MKKIPVLVALALLLVSAPVFAQGPYVGTGLVFNSPIGSDIDYLDPGFGLEIRFGYDFGPVGLEGNWMGSRHDDEDPGYTRADLSAFSLDLRIFLSPLNDPNQFYFLVGMGFYSIDEFDPFFGADTELNGEGLHFGGGLERYLNANLALNLGVIYRFIRYDEFVVGGDVFSIQPDENGDMLTAQAGILYYF